MERAKSSGGLTYRDSGVDDAAVAQALDAVGDALRATYTPQVLSAPGAFAGLVRARFEGYDDPLLAATTDSVGTKVRLAVEAGQVAVVGRDIVHHCANDLLVCGARPLFFLDYFGTSTLDSGEFSSVVRAMSAACHALGCALVKGETAQLPGFYHAGLFDLVGMMVGVVERAHLLGANRVRPGDVLLGLAASGLHTNGYSLAHAALRERAGFALTASPPLLQGDTLADALLQVHRPYGPPVLPLLPSEDIHAIAHITGGGIPGNLVRVLPDALVARVRRDTWPVPPIFRLIEDAGEVGSEEMARTFNLGIGLILVVSRDAAARVAAALTETETVYRIGEVHEGPGGVEMC